MALKKGLDQLSAWILATVAAGAFYGTCYGVMAVVAKLNPEGEGGEKAGGKDEQEQEHGEGKDHDQDHDHGEGIEHGEVKEHGEAKERTSGKHEGESEEGKREGGERADQNTPHWDYKGSLGPEHWGSLSESFKTCEIGRQQSPVDIDGPTSNAKLLPIRFHYKEGDGLVKNDGHTVLAKMQSGSYVEIDGDRYDLDEIRFHAPGEHKVASAAYDFEMHLMHKDPEGHMAILAVLFEESSPNKALAKLWKQLPGPGEAAPEPVPIDPEAYLPTRRLYYAYPGSLTTPPCTEGVKWFVFTDPVSISAKQVDEFARVVPFNARPAQALHTRKIAKSTRS